MKKEGKIIEIDPKELKIGDIIVLKKGDLLPVDGKVVNGESYVDDSNLTGETMLRFVKENTELFSGVINNGQVLEVEVLREYKDSKINKVLSLVEDASDRKSKSDKIIRKIAKIYTPLVILTAFFIVFFS